MSIIRQESSFNPNAKPDREKVLGFIPWKRKSSARPVNKPRKKGPPEFIKSLSAQPLFDSASENSCRDENNASNRLDIE